ncbi:hypothetical protein NQ117_10840 [Paenibacillus sp. SC116]|uniref:hypothetical protein n=1 Tax=Paenibacillus sp. SC116 TaxID=2968986 RepID=UPI00215A10A7|nr:hypothetical protein [Paenibacillus sp. SC116]MCR8844181.1 hypothetical protein [Paenibacillus sp. SC116]
MKVGHDVTGKTQHTIVEQTEDNPLTITVDIKEILNQLDIPLERWDEYNKKNIQESHPKT